MNFLQTAEFKVGALVLAVGALIALMSIQVSDDPSYLGRSKRVWFYLKAADGLIKNSSVKTAGIPIGVIKEIRLEDGKARVTISVKSDVGLTTSAAVRIKSVGILGDRHVDVYPGNPGDPELPDGGQITIVKDTGGLDNLVSEVGEITGSLKNVAKALEESVLEDGTRKHALGRIVHNIERITADISQITAENKDKIGDIVDQVHDITATLDKLINDESEKGLKKTWDKAMARIDSSLKNIDEITSKINRGEGTLGKLVNDDTTVEELNTAIQGVSGMFDSASRIQTAFDVRGDYLGVVGQSKGYLGVQITPGLDRYYYVALVDDPMGVVEETETVTTGTTTANVNERKRYKNKTKFTALFAKNFYDWTLKGGLIENAAGFGFDYYIYRRKFRFTTEFFDLSKLNMRSYLRYDLGYGFYLTGGMNDILDKQSVRSYYVGAGLFLTNDDLKLLLSRSPF